MNKTPRRKKREARDKKIYAHFTKLIAQPGAMATACDRVIMKKFNVSYSTVNKVKRQFKNKPDA